MQESRDRFEPFSLAHFHITQNFLSTHQFQTWWAAGPQRPLLRDPSVSLSQGHFLVYLALPSVHKLCPDLLILPMWSYGTQHPSFPITM